MRGLVPSTLLAALIAALLEAPPAKAAPPATPEAAPSATTAKATAETPAAATATATTSTSATRLGKRDPHITATHVLAIGLPLRIRGLLHSAKGHKAKPTGPASLTVNHNLGSQARERKKVRGGEGHSRGSRLKNKPWNPMG